MIPNRGGRPQNSPHHLLPLSSSSATLNNLQQRSRVHFGWEAGIPKPVCKLSAHQDTLPCHGYHLFDPLAWAKNAKGRRNTHHSMVSSATLYATRPFVAETNFNLLQELHSASLLFSLASPSRHIQLSVVLQSTLSNEYCLMKLMLDLAGYNLQKHQTSTKF
ncbi:hypothetical protein NC653_035445 [Populus alba x Populus x berolinensis]|uniref:Uncharacterized protein n=1 Tax=Populus alba x Populus x berolinensis TaxID=444605 RepID=A0AAD6LQ16_9ROSI|nr:hypothetical protein NC653_035445 [Populus alba x Populus x berolinensis]